MFLVLIGVGFHKASEADPGTKSVAYWVLGIAAAIGVVLVVSGYSDARDYCETLASSNDSSQFQLSTQKFPVAYYTEHCNTLWPNGP
jgi:hypothetical protein